MTGTNSDLNKYASLSSGLLARKGDARPAMRRPTVDLPHGDASGADDLGWNDFGAEAQASQPGHHDEPEVKRQQKAIAARLGAETGAVMPAAVDVDAVVRPVMREMKIKARRNGRAASRHGSAAFTLRLDAERHLKLRLACAVHNVSAQKLLTEALDALIESMPELEPLAEHVASN